MTRPSIIGLSAPSEYARWSFWSSDAMIVPHSYLDAIARAGGVAVAAAADPRMTAEPAIFLDRVDALLLVGGADIDPSRYGAPKEPSTEATYPDRDDFEIVLTREAIARGMPFLGVCRGMQLLNVALGGTLHQDIATAEGIQEHRRTHGGFEGTDRRVTLAAGSLAANAAGQTRHVVHCHHHQAVERLGDGVVASGWADTDGVVEAIEVPDAGFALGVQWHPEANVESRVIAALVEAAASSRPGLPMLAATSRV